MRATAERRRGPLDHSSRIIAAAQEGAETRRSLRSVTTRVLVVGAVRLYRDGLAQALATVQGLDVVGTAADLEGALAEVAHDTPDVVLVDLMQSGVDVIRALGGLAPAVVALVVPDSEEEVVAPAEAGVAGYV